MNLMGNTSQPRMSESLRRAQRWYPPAMVAAGAIMAAGVMPWGGRPAGSNWVPLLASLVLLIALAWWMNTRRAMPKGGGAALSGAVLAFMVLRTVTSLLAQALGGAPWLWYVGPLVSAVPFFVIAGVVARRLRAPNTPAAPSDGGHAA